jgi:predicted transcriptional regulator
VVVIPEHEHQAQQGIISHYGTPRHSGRYPYGSGEDPQRNHTLLSTADELKKQGFSETEIARGLGVTTTELRDIRTIVRIERKQDEIHMAQQLKAKGMSNGAIAVRMREAGYKVSGESQVRALLKPMQERKTQVFNTVTDTLRKAVDEKGYLDVGSGVEFQLDITSTKLRASLRQLQDEGYEIREVKIEQLGTGNQTNMKVLAKPGTTWGDVQRNRHNIRQLQEYSEDGGMTALGILPPLSINSKRIDVRYAEQGGADADGVIYVRRGVSDVSLGRSPYAQVRIMVDGTYYLKGMAIYKDDLPDGVDLQFNTNKSRTNNKLDAMKKITDDPDNPFGSTVRQIGEKIIDPTTGKEKMKRLTSAMNLVNEAGNWDDWSKSLSSQVLSKQTTALAKEQLDLTYQKKKTEFDTIMRLTNPSVRRKLLEAYAASADSSAVHLKAAHLPRQKTQVILPISDIKPTEVFAPGFRDGERVALIRFPHGGTFEIPELTVNNKNPMGRKLLGPDAQDAIGIHPKTAERLSGADFDGDSVLVIPNNQGRIRSTPALEGLKDFDPKTTYAPYHGMRTIDGGVYDAKTKSVDYGDRRPSSLGKGMQMGLVSNLITDMTIGGANSDELARAVRHSMVVIDAEKHNLDYRRSAQDNGIAALMKSYQNSSQGGASTLISRATSPKKVPERKERAASKGGPIDPNTGKIVYENTNKTRTWTDQHGTVHVHENKTLTTKLADTDDAHTLSSGTVIEKVYADHSNRLKSLANQARKELVTIKSRKYNPAAKEAYRSDVETLNAKLNLALRNAPLERQAQVFANATVRLKIQANPNLRERDNQAELKRVKSQALAAARARTGADKQRFDIKDTEWAAIQAGAITAHKLDQILTYADLDRIKELATPRVTIKMTPNNAAKARNLHARGYTWAEIADALGVSVSTIKESIGNTEEGD